MRREEYEALETSGGGGESDGLSQGFEKASEGVRRKRRIIKASRPKTPSDSNSGVTNTSQSEKKTGAFANFSFGTPAAAATGGFGAGSKSESKASSTLAPTGGFSFGTTPAPKTGFSFTAGEDTTIAPGSTTQPFSFGSSGSNGGGDSAEKALHKEYQKKSKKLHLDFLTFIQPYVAADADISKPLSHYLDAGLCLEQEYLAKKKKLAQSGGGSSGTATTKVSFAASPAPGAPLFGVPSQKSAGTPAASTPGFSFTGGNTPAASTTGVVSNTPGLTPAGNTFAATAPGDASANADDTGDTGNDDSDAVLEGDADKDWTTLDIVMNSHFYVMAEGSQKKEKIAGGGKLKIQEHKESKTRRMIMRNEASGKVLLNLSVGKGMPTIPMPDGKHKKHINGIENVMIVGILKEGQTPQKILVRRVIDTSATPLIKVLEKAVKL